MPTFIVFYLSAVIGSFVVLAACFAWDEYRTRHV